MRERLRKIIEVLDVNQSGLAKEIGLTPSAITDFFKGRSNSLSSSALVQISEKYNVSIDWLLTGEGSMFLSDRENSTPEPVYLAAPEDASELPAEPKAIARALAELPEEELRLAASYVSWLVSRAHRAPRKVKEPLAKYNRPEITEHLIPLVGRIAAGIPFLAVENFERILSIPADLIPRRKYHKLFALTVRGSSMIGANIADGDIVVLECITSLRDEVRNGDIVAALIDGEATLKRLFYTNEHLELRAENPDFEPIILAKNAFACIQGKLVKSFRDVV